MSKENLEPSVEDQLIGFISTGQPILKDAAAHLERMSQEDRLALADEIREVIADEGMENEGAQTRSEWVRRLGTKTGLGILELMMEKTKIMAGSGYIPQGGRHSSASKGKYYANPQ